MEVVEQVQLAVYDLTNGMAKTMASSLLGIELEAIYHTGVRVFGYEYFFSSGIQKMRPEEVEIRFGMTPIRIELMGETELPEEIVDGFVDENRNRFSEETYDLINHNCNNFSDELVFFLTSMHIPEEILELPQRLLSTPLGQQVVPLLRQMGATKAIPLSTSKPRSSASIPAATSSTPHVSSSASLSKPTSKPSPSFDLSCMSLWSRSNIDMSKAYLRQLCYDSTLSPAIANAVRLGFFLSEKAARGEVSFGGIQKAMEFISAAVTSTPANSLDILTSSAIPSNNQNNQNNEIITESNTYQNLLLSEDILFHFLILITPQLAIIASHMDDHLPFSQTLVFALIELLVRISSTYKTNPNDRRSDYDKDDNSKHSEKAEKVRLSALIALCSLLSIPHIIGVLQKEGKLMDIIQTFTLSPTAHQPFPATTNNGNHHDNHYENGKSYELYGVEWRVAIACLFAQICKGVEVSGENRDTSDECVAVLNQMAEEVWEEESADVLEQRICGLYLLVTRGDITEKVVMQSIGVGNGIEPKAGDRGGRWATLLSLLSE